MYAKGKGPPAPPVPSEQQAKEKLAIYVYEYLSHVGAPKAAASFLQEIQFNRSITLQEPPGFLQSWWCVFWDLYCAAPERRDTAEHSHEAKVFHDYGFGAPFPPAALNGGAQQSPGAAPPPEAMQHFYPGMMRPPTPSSQQYRFAPSALVRPVQRMDFPQDEMGDMMASSLQHQVMPMDVRAGLSPGPGARVSPGVRMSGPMGPAMYGAPMVRPGMVQNGPVPMGAMQMPHQGAPLGPRWSNPGFNTTPPPPGYQLVSGGSTPLQSPETAGYSQPQFAQYSVPSGEMADSGVLNGAEQPPSIPPAVSRSNPGTPSTPGRQHPHSAEGEVVDPMGYGSMNTFKQEASSSAESEILKLKQSMQEEVERFESIQQKMCQPGEEMADPSPPVSVPPPAPSQPPGVVPPGGGGAEVVAATGSPTEGSEYTF